MWTSIIRKQRGNGATRMAKIFKLGRKKGPPIPPKPDYQSLDPQEEGEYSYHDPDRWTTAEPRCSTSPSGRDSDQRRMYTLSGADQWTEEVSPRPGSASSGEGVIVGSPDVTDDYSDPVDAKHGTIPTSPCSTERYVYTDPYEQTEDDEETDLYDEPYESVLANQNDSGDTELHEVNNLQMATSTGVVGQADDRPPVEYDEPWDWRNKKLQEQLQQSLTRDSMAAHKESTSTSTEDHAAIIRTMSSTSTDDEDLENEEQVTSIKSKPEYENQDIIHSLKLQHDEEEDGSYYVNIPNKEALDKKTSNASDNAVIPSHTEFSANFTDTWSAKKDKTKENESLKQNIPGKNAYENDSVTAAGSHVSTSNREVAGNPRYQNVVPHSQPLDTKYQGYDEAANYEEPWDLFQKQEELENKIRQAQRGKHNQPKQDGRRSSNEQHTQGRTSSTSSDAPNLNRHSRDVEGVPSKSFMFAKPDTSKSRPKSPKDLQHQKPTVQLRQKNPELDSYGQQFTSRQDDIRPQDEYEAPWDLRAKKLSHMSAAMDITSAGGLLGLKGRPESTGHSMKKRPTPFDLGCRAKNAMGERVDPFIPLEEQRWYHGAITRSQAEDLLRVHKEGSYLLRQSESNKNDFSLSLKGVAGFIHMKVLHKDGKYILGLASQPFATISEMIHHYTINKLNIKGADHMILLHPITYETL